MRSEEELYQQIANRMAAAVPQTAAAAIYTGKIYASHEQCGLSWLGPSGEVQQFPFGRRPERIEFELRELIGEVRNLMSRSDREPWTHFQIMLRCGAKINMIFAYIPEDDDWVGVFMRRVSDLTLEEANAAYIPEKDWREFRRKRLEADSTFTS